MSKLQLTIEAIVADDTVGVAVQAITGEGNQVFGKASHQLLASESLQAKEAIVDETIRQVKAAAIGQVVAKLLMEGKL